MNQEQLEKVRSGKGFIAALDQSGGSTPKALRLYGVEESEYSGDDEMFDRIHQMRTRIMVSPSFTGERVLGAILFEQTMDREVEGKLSGDHLWSVKGVVPFLKVDKGLADEVDGAQVMKPIDGLDALLARAVERGMFGTKMRSVIKLADTAGVDAVVDQQFEIGARILASGLVPIIEPEVDITSPEKAEAEELLKAAIHRALEGAVVEGVRRVAGLGEVALLEGVGVEDHRAALLEPRQLGPQRGRVHGHQHLGRVAGRGDVVIGDVDLERGDTREGACRRADLGRVLRQRHDVVADQRRHAGEAVAGELHAVAGVAGEVDDDAIQLDG